MTAKIIKFGSITEDEDGLVFQNFHIDMDGRADKEVAILELVIERLKLELAAIQQELGVQNEH